MRKQDKIGGGLIGLGGLLLLLSLVFVDPTEEKAGEEEFLESPYPLTREEPAVNEGLAQEEIELSTLEKGQTENENGAPYPKEKKDQPTPNLGSDPRKDSLGLSQPLGFWDGNSESQWVDTSIQPARDERIKTETYTPKTINKTIQATPVRLHVEFQTSPLRYTGYKLEGKNLVLYGIDTAQALRFVKHQEEIWMYYKNYIYLLKNSPNLRRFEEVPKEADTNHTP